MAVDPAAAGVVDCAAALKAMPKLQANARRPVRARRSQGAVEVWGMRRVYGEAVWWLVAGARISLHRAGHVQACKVLGVGDIGQIMGYQQCRNGALRHQPEHQGAHAFAQGGVEFREGLVQ